MAKEEEKQEVEMVPVNKNLLINTINYLGNKPYVEVEQYVVALTRELLAYENNKKDAKSSDSRGDSVSG